MDPAIEPALQARDISARLNHTRNPNNRHFLLVDLSATNKILQNVTYGMNDSSTCEVYREAKRRGKTLPKKCEAYDCNGLRNPCPRNYNLLMRV